jgi:acetyl esterase/lipase
MNQRLVRFSALLLLAFLPALRAARAEVSTIKLGGNFEVEVVKDVAYVVGADVDPDKHKLDLYLPKGQKDFPVLMFVHGGSWRSGDRKMYAPLGNVLAKNGVGTVIISYRLSPKVQHPGHIQDVAKAFAWTCTNIGKHGGRPDQVFACGHSAGGHLVALLGTDENYLKSEKRGFADLKGVIAISGVYSIFPGAIFESAFGKNEEAVKNASPLKHVKEKLCPFCLLYAEKEYPTLDVMAEQMGQALKDCKCDASITKLKDRDHISIIRKAASDETDPVVQAIFEFMAKHSSLKLTRDSKACRPAGSETDRLVARPDSHPRGRIHHASAYRLPGLPDCLHVSRAGTWTKCPLPKMPGGFQGRRAWGLNRGTDRRHCRSG